MQSTYRRGLFGDICYIILFSLLVTLAIWLPFLLNLKNFYFLDFSNGFSTIYKNYDGLEYIMVAKSWYQPDIIQSLPLNLSNEYYAARFPLVPALIWSVAPILGYLKSMLFVSQLFFIGSAIMFYLFIKKFKLTEHPLFLTFVFMVLPPRWVAVHSIGSTETVLIFFTLLCLFFFMSYETKNKFLYIFLSGLFGAFAVLTRSPGILIFIALGLYLLWKFVKEKWGFEKTLYNILHYSPLLLMPIALLGIFYFYSFVFGSFWAYFQSGDNIHLVFPPYQVFNSNQSWVGTIWLEDIIYVFLIGFIGMLLLFKQKLYPLAFFVLTYLIASILVAHRDISRYTLPIFPFLIIAFEKFINTREFKIALIIILLAIYLYTQNFLLGNTAPVDQLQLLN